MALGQAQSLADRFVWARRQVSSWRLVSWALGKSYQGFVKGLARVSPRLLRAIAGHLRGQMPGLCGKHWQRGRWVLLGVDGSKIDLPRTQALDQSFGAAGQKKSGPQAVLTTILHLTTGLPWDAWMGRADASERGHLRRMVARLPLAALLVADAGFVGYALWSLLQASGRHFLIRVGANVKLLRGLGYAVVERGDLVYLWPDRERRAGRAPLVLRLIRLHDGRREVSLITNVLDPEQLSDQEAREAYRLRWGIELWFRQLKQTALRRKLASKAPRQATLELAWLLVAMTLLGMLGVHDAIARGHDPLALSPAQALGALHQLAQQPHLRGGLRTLRARLGHCRKDRYRRHAPKCRVDWPRKKREHPPGAPRISDATAAQVAAAAAIRCHLAPS